MTDNDIIEPTLNELAEWLAEQTWSDFAVSLANFYRARGFLTPKQEQAARSMRAKILAKAAMKIEVVEPGMPPVYVAPPPKGVHRNADGDVFKVYTTQLGKLVTKKL